MAEEIKKVINIDVSQGVSNVDTLRDKVNGLGTSFKSASNEIVNTVPGVNKLNTAFKALATNPIGAVIAAIAAAVVAVGSAIKGSEPLMNRWKVATSGLKVVTDGLKNVLSGVANVIVTVVEKATKGIQTILTKARDFAKGLGWEKMANRIDGVINKIEEYQNLEEKELDLDARRRQIAVELAKIDNKVAETRAKLAETDKYSVEERLKLIEEWEAAEKRKAALDVSLAKAEYEAIKQRNSLTDSSTKDLNAENDAYVRLIKAQGEEASALRNVNKQKSALLKEMGKATEVIDDETEAFEENIDAIIKKQQEEEKLYKKSHDDRMALLDEEAAKNEFYSTLEIDNEREKADIVYEINRQLLENKIAIQEDYVNNFLGSVEEQMKAEKQLADYREQLNRLNLTNEKRVNGQIVEDARRSQEAKIDYAFNYAYAMADVFSALSDLSEEGSEEQKSYAVMAATINTLASLVGVIYSVWSDPTIPSSIAKAALSVTMGAGVLASGLAQVNKIKNTNKDGGGLSGGISMDTPTIPDVGVTPLLNEEQDIQSLQSLSVSGDNQSKGTRVYVVESDITQSQNATKTKVSNSTF